jgi:AcrR family transcriptional regulator
MARTRASDFEEKRQLILTSAAAVFAEQGMEKASMSQIATHCHVSKALLYHYYPSKGALIFGIIQSHLADLDTAVEAANDQSLEPEQRLHQLIWAVLDSYRGADNHHKVQLNGIDALTDEQKSEIRRIERRIVGRFSDVIRQINPGLDSKERPLIMPVTMSLFGMLNWVYMWFRDGGAMTREDYAKLATTLILEGLKAVR